MAETMNTLLAALLGARQQRQNVRNEAAVRGSEYVGNIVAQELAQDQLRREAKKKEAQGIGFASKMAGEPEGSWIYQTPELGAQGDIGALEAAAKLKQSDTAHLANVELAKIAAAGHLAAAQARPSYGMDIANLVDERTRHAEAAKIAAEEARRSEENAQKIEAATVKQLRENFFDPASRQVNELLDAAQKDAKYKAYARDISLNALQKKITKQTADALLKEAYKAIFGMTQEEALKGGQSRPPPTPSSVLGVPSILNMAPGAPVR